MAHNDNNNLPLYFAVKNDGSRLLTEVSEQLKKLQQ